MACNQRPVSLDAVGRGAHHEGRGALGLEEGLELEQVPRVTVVEALEVEVALPVQQRREAAHPRPLRTPKCILEPQTPVGDES
jgi:hypothetical protein